MEMSARRDLARVLLIGAMDGQGGPSTLPDRAERAFQELCGELAALVTKVGSRALFERALYLTRPEFPFFARVRTGPTPDSALAGLRDGLSDVDPKRAREGLAALLANLIGLLITFIGEDLTLRLVSHAWEGGPRDQPDSEQREA